ncbi:unnamed protein product [Diplocarpon coronariae]
MVTAARFGVFSNPTRGGYQRDAGSRLGHREPEPIRKACLTPLPSGLEVPHPVCRRPGATLPPSGVRRISTAGGQAEREPPPASPRARIQDSRAGVKLLFSTSPAIFHGAHGNRLSLSTGGISMKYITSRLLISSSPHLLTPGPYMQRNMKSVCAMPAADKANLPGSSGVGAGIPPLPVQSMVASLVDSWPPSLMPAHDPGASQTTQNPMCCLAAGLTSQLATTESRWCNHISLPHSPPCALKLPTRFFAIRAKSQSPKWDLQSQADGKYRLSPRFRKARQPSEPPPNRGQVNPRAANACKSLAARAPRINSMWARARDVIRGLDTGRANCPRKHHAHPNARVDLPSLCLARSRSPRLQSPDAKAHQREKNRRERQKLGQPQYVSLRARLITAANPPPQSSLTCIRPHFSAIGDRALAAR